MVIIKNTGSPATYSDGEGDWQIDFNEFPNTAGLNTVWTGAVAPGLPGTLAS